MDIYGGETRGALVYSASRKSGRTSVTFTKNLHRLVPFRGFVCVCHRVANHSLLHDDFAYSCYFVRITAVASSSQIEPFLKVQVVACCAFLSFRIVFSYCNYRSWFAFLC